MRPPAPGPSVPPVPPPPAELRRRHRGSTAQPGRPGERNGNSDFMVISYYDSMGFYRDLMGFDWDLIAFYNDLMGNIPSGKATELWKATIPHK